MRRVLLPISARSHDIPDNQTYKLIERTDVHDPEAQYIEYTFFPKGDPKEFDVHVCTQTSQVDGNVEQFLEVRPLDLFLLTNSPETKERRVPTKTLLPGTRIRFAQTLPNGKTVSGEGTVILHSPRKGIVSLYTDLSVSDFTSFSGTPKQYRIPRGHGITISSTNIAPLSSVGYDFASLKKMPLGAGVAIAKDFIYRHPNGRDYRVKAGSCGRLLSVNDGWAMVSWYNWGTTQHSSVRMDNEHLYDYCMTIPTSELQYGTLDPAGRIRAYWGQRLTSDLKVGDYVVYDTNSPCRIEHLERNRSFTKGSILQIVGQDEGGRVITVKLVGGCKLDEIGSKARLDSGSVAPLTETFIPKDATIEIVAELEFKKKSLQGQQALVLIPTDQDGDIGVQFNEDINGGSLDGVGESGRCLYIPASVVKVSE